MTRLFLLCAVVSGCLYTDPINQRPSLDIERIGGGTEVFRKDRVDLRAVANDPEGRLVFFQWRAYACTNTMELPSGARPGCDDVPFFTAVLDQVNFNVPDLRADGVTPAEQILVLLEGEDEYGATAKPVQRLELSVSNYAPDITLRADPIHGKVVNTTINIYAEVGDKDDGFQTATLAWTVFSPANQPTYDFNDITVPQDPADPAHLQLGKAFKPHGVGDDWEIQLQVTDVLGKSFTQSLVVPVVDDHPPCLGQWAPLATLTPPLPLTEATLFQVHVVNDDLDPYPQVPGDAELGAAAFTWSILPPAASVRQVLTSVTGNSVGLDPANYQPGDIVELRVEVADRVSRSLAACGDAAQTCSLTGDSCSQRQTWRVEIH